MFDADYKRGMEALGPSDAQMEQVLAALEQAEERPMKTTKNTARTVLLAAALCAALAVTALAVSPTLREALGAMLNGFEGYTQTLDETSVVVDGIEIKVLSALSDPYTGRLYYEVKDLTGERVDGKTMVDLEIEPEDEDWTNWSWSGGVSLYYDAESKTALMSSQMQWPRNPVENRRIHVKFSELISGIEWLSIPFPQDVALTQQVLACETLEDGRVVLLPGQTYRALETDCYALSSFGFGSDNRLHFLYQINDENFNLKESLFRVWLGSKEDRAVLDSGKRTNCPRETGYNNGAPDPVLFRRDGKLYCDVCQNAGIEDFDDIIVAEKIEGWFCTGVVTEGPWEMEVPLVNATTREIDMRETPIFNGGTTKSLSLSVLGATLTSTTDGATGHLSYIMTVYCADGSMIRNIWCDSLDYQEDYAVNHWTFPEPIDPQEVTAIALGLWYIPIEDGVAQPGYWLSEQP